MRVPRDLPWKLGIVIALLCLLLISQQVDRVATVSVINYGGAGSVVQSRPSMVPGRVAFIGDSYTIGAGGGGERWTTDLAAKHHWNEINLGIGGMGYVPQSYGDAYKFNCARRHCPSYLDAAFGMGERRVQMIFVSGGRNDIRASDEEIDKYSRQLFQQLRKNAPQAKIYVVSPFWGSGPFPKWLTEHGRILRANAQAAGLTYLEIGSPLATRPNLIYKDHVHPTGTGYRLLANAVDHAYAKATA